MLIQFIGDEKQYQYKGNGVDVQRGWVIDVTEEQKKHEEEERERDSQRHWEEERRIIEHNIRVSRENREAVVKTIWKEKDLKKAEEILAKYGEGERMAGRMRLGERW